LALQKNTPASAYTHYLRAKTWIAKSQLEKASAQLESALRVQPRMAEAWSDLGWTRMMLSDDPGALQAFKKAVLFNPKDPVAQYRLGTAYLRKGEATRAVEHLKVALKHGGADKPTLYNLERALRKAGEVNEAQEIRTQMAEAMKETRNSSENGLQVTSLNAEGMELEKQGNFRAATAKYRMALDLDPTAGGVRLNYGLSLCRQHQWKDGIAEIEEVLRADPDNGAATRALYIAREQAEAESKVAKQD
jgi:tetratricopeptide (TPR) repeat protein